MIGVRWAWLERSDMGVECAMSLAGVEGGPWIITGDDHAPPDSSELLTEASS